MQPTFQRIAYHRVDVANPTHLGRVLAMIDHADLPANGVALDIGAGTGAVTVALAEAYGLTVHAIERDAALAEVIRERAAIAGLPDQVCVHEQNSAAVLAALPPADLVVALGATHPAGRPGLDPEASFRALSTQLRDFGYLLWGDLFWKGDPPAPLRRVLDLTGERTTHAGWRAAGVAAGLTCLAAEEGSEADWDAYVGGSDARVRAWLDAHPDAPEAGGIRARAEQRKALFEFGRPWLGFGLYLFRKGEPD